MSRNFLAVKVVLMFGSVRVAVLVAVLVAAVILVGVLTHTWFIF